MKPLMVGSFGNRGTGKTAWTKQWLRKHGGPRVMVWDYKSDPNLTDYGDGHRSWGDFVRACTQKRFIARYLVNFDLDLQEQFAAFCELAWREGCLTMVVDELPMVTKANRAPPRWQQCVNVGRDYNDGGRKWLQIVGVGQRMAEVDKTFLDQLDILHVGRLGLGCAKRLKTMWGTDEQLVANLPDLHWLERDQSRPGIASGVLSFSQKAPAVKPAKTRP